MQKPNSISDAVDIVIFTQVKHFQLRTRKPWCSVWKFLHDTCFENVQVFCFLLVPIECPLYQCWCQLSQHSKARNIQHLTSTLVSSTVQTQNLTFTFFLDLSDQTSNLKNNNTKMSVIAHTFSVSSMPEKVLKENNRKCNLKRSRGSSLLLPKSCIGSAKQQQQWQPQN